MENGTFSVGIDLGGTKLLACLIDENWQVKEEVKKKTRPERGPQAVVERIVEVVDALIEKSGQTKDSLKAIGIGVPGTVDSVSGTVIYAPNMPGWSQIPIGAMLHERLTLPVAVGNDVNMGLFGEHHFGAARGYNYVVGVFVGTGVGGGLIVEGKLVHGANNLAGEFGHMVIQRKLNGRICGCGNRGCLEAYAGRKSIVQKIASRRDTDGYSSMLKGMDFDALTSGKLNKALKQNDRLVTKTIKTACKDIGSGIASLLNILDPEVIVLGGGVIEAMADFMFPLIQQAVKEHTLSYDTRKTHIVLSQLGDHAVALGAASYAFNQIQPLSPSHPV
ncbi:MAG TPA: ROK family protein [Thermodesulfovibrionia bacterium]|nr:ROK family protein [Thermodesulfovibrionia bacterium]